MPRLSVEPACRPRGAGLAPDDDGDTLAVYVHWPFCVSKCPYCDFNSHVRASVDEAAYRDALLAELEHEAVAAAGRRVTSVFFGGGTPSLMQPATVAAVLDRVAARWRVEEGAEVTLEANPTSVEAGCFQALAAAGVNRVSLGLQALDDAALRTLGRPHDLAEGLAAFDLALATFERVSFDLIYARPQQTLEGWRAELGRALALGTHHLSLYGLTIEPGTGFAARQARGEIALPGEALAADLYELTGAMTADRGLRAYEVSNYARAGQESRHNLTYWRYGDYVGIGPGAHGRRAGRATTRIRKPERWLAAVSDRGHATESDEPLAPPVRAREALVMGLRLAEGVEEARFRRRTGTGLEEALDLSAVTRLAALGLLTATPERLAVTAAGRPLLDRILAEMVR